MVKSEILVPLLNANEPEAKLVRIHIIDRQAVEKGALLFTIETTKASSDIEASLSGFVHILAKEGETLLVGERLGVITDTIDEHIEFKTLQKKALNTFGNLRITKPAQKLAEILEIDITTLPTDKLVTEKVIRQYSGKNEFLSGDFPMSNNPYILIYGAGGHAKSVMEMVLQNKMYTIAGIIDDDHRLLGSHVLGIPVLGTRGLLRALIDRGVNLAANGVGGIIDIGLRVGIFQILESTGFSFPGLTHPRATVEPSANIEDGVQIFANAYVGSEATLHSRCMINTNAVVSHDCEIGPYSHIAPGALLAGHVRIGERTLIGMGVTTSIGVKIGSGVRIGNGAIILADVPDKMVVQAGRYWVGKAN